MTRPDAANSLSEAPWGTFVLDDVHCGDICPRCGALVPAGEARIGAGPETGQVMAYKRVHTLWHIGEEAAR